MSTELLELLEGRRQRKAKLICPLCKVEAVDKACPECKGRFMPNGKFAHYRNSGLIFRSGQMLRRVIHPEIRTVDEKKGVCQYIASDETLDSYREVIRADGWQFDQFQKNAPFVDSHNYYTVENLLGRVTDYRVEGRKLVETVQWAIDVPDNKLAQLGWKMTCGGYLKAVSVGFTPVRMVSKWDQEKAPYIDQLRELGYTEANGPRVIYLAQQQLELSACIIGANPNALQNMAQARKAQVVTDDDLILFSEEYSKAQETAHPAKDAAAAGQARLRQRRQRLLEEIETLTKRL
jgi:hypothetical protein